MTPIIVLTLLTMHFVADFLMQTSWMATNKSRSWLALLAHTSSYSVVFTLVSLKFALVTLVVHTLTDAFTSRVTSRLWQKQEWHWFFAVIGADQLSHFYQLILTYIWLR